MRLKKGDTVEVSSDEEGFTGAWFSATILRKVGKGKGNAFLVEFRDLMTDDEKSKLKEKVKAHLIRPEPPALNRQCFFLNEEVDVYDQDGWWRGVVDGILPQNKYVVHFSQTLEKLEYDITQLRLHQDWTHGKWVNNSEACDVYGRSWRKKSKVWKPQNCYKCMSDCSSRGVRHFVSLIQLEKPL